jgi:hypothetical protein
MSRKPIISLAIFLAIGTAWAFNWQSSTAQVQAAIGETSNESVEILARGPVHEAFAEPLNLQAFDPLVIEMPPPVPVEELPPDQKPEGDNVEWIPGYWAWDDDLKNFIWVSGVWRDIPPGQRWVPGYWSEAQGGWFWTAGFWVSEAAEVIEYLPAPPETLEVGPQIEAPSDDYVWVPGIWRYQQSRFVWRPGYWTVVHPGWVWVPARYIWCPSGYVFVDGYWDYPIDERGVLFAPVYYHEPVYRQATYYYTPTVVISTDILMVHLFASPRYCHYYFGDYYAPHYREIGIEPWLMFSRNRGCYDPLFHYYSWDYRRHGRGDWNRTLRDRYDFFARHEDYRPAHTYAGLRRQRFDRVRTGDINIDNNIQNIVVQQNNLAVSINQYVQNVEKNVRIDGGRGDRRGRMRFARLGDDDRRRFVENARDIRGFQERRSEIEREARVGDRGDRGDRGQLARGDRGARRSLRLADFPARQGDRGAGERGDRRDGRGRDRARIAADVPPTPEQTAGRIGAPTGPTQDATTGGRDNRRGRSFDRPDRADVTQGVQDAIGGRGTARDQAGVRDSLRRQDNAIRDEQRARDAVGRRGRGRDNSVDLGRVGRDGPQYPSARIPGADRDATPQSLPGATTLPGGTSLTDPTGAGTTTNDRLDALRRGRAARGDRTPGRGNFDSTDPRNGLNVGDPQRNEELRRRQQALRDELGIDDGQRRAERSRRGTVSGSSPRGQGDLRGGQNPLGTTVPGAPERTFRRGIDDRDASDLGNRQVRGRGDENRSQADPLRQRGDNRDALRSRGQFDEDATRRAAQSQQQEALRRQMDQLRERERSNRSNNLEQFRNERREARRQADAAADAEPWNRQQSDRGRSDSDFSRGRGNERSAIRDAGRPDSDARRRALESLQNQQAQRPSPDFGQRGGFDVSRMQRGAAGRADNDTGRQFRPEARSAFGGRGGGDGGAEALQRSNRGRSGAEDSQQSNRGGGGRSIARQREQSTPEVNRAERRGDSGSEDRRGGGRGGRGRDRDNDD